MDSLDTVLPIEIVVFRYSKISVVMPQAGLLFVHFYGKEKEEEEKSPEQDSNQHSQYH